MLETFLDDHDVQICIGTETWLTSDISDNEIFPNKNYTVYRRDRTTGNGGCVMIAIRNDLVSHSVSLTDVNDTSEQVWCRVDIPSKFSIYICSFYRPPNSDELPLMNLYDSLQKAITGESGSCSRKIIVSGDFNLPEIDWNSICTDNNPKSQSNYTKPRLVNSLLDCMYTFNLKQCVLSPTRFTPNCQNILDLLFTSIYEFDTQIKIVPGFSDHEAVLSNIDFDSLLFLNLKRISCVLKMLIGVPLNIICTISLMILSQNIQRSHLMKTGYHLNHYCKV